ncbi:MAG: hypothetical protein HGB02_09055 [Chlorobiaceae bacterium]|nr:hypothetical protein [Chlorobiaceae bacterium]
MDAADGQNGNDMLAVLERSVGKLVAQLTECRKENELLKSEVSSLQNILRSFKLPGTEGTTPGLSSAGDGFSAYEKLQVKQKLALILQKIERELRGDQVRF